MTSEYRKKRIAVVTGACGGMGHALVRKLISEGYYVFGLDRKEAENGPASGFCFVPADLTDNGSVEEAFRKISGECEQIDVLVHMAGIYDLNSLVEMDEEEFLRIFNVNLFAVFRVNRTFLPLLKKGGRILITTSELAPLDPLPFTGIYGITKTAVEKYADSLRKELQLLDIHTIILRPGAVDTGLLNVSTKRLDDFCANTKLYSYNAKRFRTIVDKVEARKVPPEKIADLAYRAISADHPKLIYKINRNPLLVLMNLLPDRMQDWILRIILRQ